MSGKPETGQPESQLETDEMVPEYRFDYSKSRPNRFAGKIKLPENPADDERPAETRPEPPGTPSSRFPTRRDREPIVPVDEKLMARTGIRALETKRP